MTCFVRCCLIHLLQQREDLAETLEYPAVWFAKGSGLRKVVDGMYEQVGGKPTSIVETEEDEVIAGLVAAGIFSMVLNAVALTLYNKLAVNVIPQNMATLLLAMVLPTSFMGMMGDLSASVLKRNFEVKDFGKIFPGHGGVMDRMDSSLFTLPVTYAIALIASKIF